MSVAYAVVKAFHMCDFLDSDAVTTKAVVIGA